MDIHKLWRVRQVAAQVATTSTKRGRTTSSKTVARVVQDASAQHKQKGWVVAGVFFFFRDARVLNFSTDGLRRRREKTKTCPREAILTGASDDEHFGDLFITKTVRLGFITAADVDRRHFATVSTFAGAAIFERTDISNRPNFVHEQCRSVHPRGWGAQVAPPGALGASFRAPSACREFICELMSSERALWLFVPHLSWRSQGSLRGHANVYAHVPSSSIVSLRKILRQTSAQDHVPDTELPKLVNEGSRSKVCARQKSEMWGVCHESRSLVYMMVGTWCLPM